MDIASLENGLTVLEQDERLWLEPNLRLRQTAFEFIAVAEEFLQHPSQPTQTRLMLQQRLITFKTNLTEINNILFKRLQTQIRADTYRPTELRAEFNRYTDYGPHLIGQPQYGQDGLDILLDGIFEFNEPAHLQLNNSDMVHYEPAPARLILELLDRAQVTSDDVFYDLGSGLGRVVLTVNLLSKIVSKGIEIDPLLHAIANRTTQQFGLAKAVFVQSDVRAVDLSDGTIFFLFTPFMGQMFRDVVAQLQRYTVTKPIKIFSYGACSFWLAAQPWLHPVGTQTLNDFTLAYFEPNL